MSVRVHGWPTSRPSGARGGYHCVTIVREAQNLAGMSSGGAMNRDSIDERLQQPRERELRLALAMRGGISLAVWIGGAVAEIEQLRAATPGDQDYYARLLKRAGYSGVTVDVLAGASAGGLNAVMYAYAQHRGLGMDFALGVWEDAGALWKLMRPAWGQRGDYTLVPPGFRLPSVLSGDYFYLRLAQALAEAQPLATRPKMPQYLSVDLSATLRDARFDPRNHEGSAGRGRKPHASSEAHFRFQLTPASPRTPYNDFPDPLGDSVDRQFEAALPPALADKPRRFYKRFRAALPLALAGRSTSSFPGAFEPVTIPVRGVETKKDAASNLLAPMDAVFGAEADPMGNVHEVIDGGIFDNIPIDRAMAAIAASPADGPTNRVLLYLDPTPPDQRWRGTAGLGDSLLATVARTFTLQVRDETSDDEVARIRAANDAEARARGRGDLLAAGASDGDGQRRGWNRSTSSGSRSAGAVQGLLDSPDLPARYVTFRAREDAARIADTLAAPRLRFVRSGVEPQPGLLPMDALDILPLKEHIVAAYSLAAQRDSDFADKLLHDEASVIGMVTSLLTWVRMLDSEDISSAQVAMASRLKEKLYRVRAVATHMQDLALLHWAEKACTSLPSPPDLAIELCSYQPAGLDELPNCAAEVFRRLGDLQDSAAAPECHTDVLWTALHECFTRLRTISPRRPQEFPRGPQEAWEDSIFTRLAALPRKTDLGLLNAAICVTGGPLRGTGEVRYHEITGDQHPTFDVSAIERSIMDRHAERYVAGRDEKRPKQVDDEKVGDEKVGDEKVDPTVRADDKLAGSLLWAFGGFLDDGWRRRDWMWGRVDAASGLIDLLTEELCDECVRDAADVEAAAVDGTLQLAVEDIRACDHLDASTTDGSDNQRNHDLDRLKAVAQLRVLDPGQAGKEVASLNLPTPRWEDLRPGYRFAVGARLLQLLFRALWPKGRRQGPPGPSGQERSKIAFAQWFAAVLLVLARPLLVLVPLVLRPAALVACWLPLLVLTHPPEAGLRQWMAVSLVLLLAGSCLVTARRLWIRSRRWEDMDSDACEMRRQWPEPPRYRLRVRQSEAAVWLVALACMALLPAAVLVGRAGLRLPVTLVEAVTAVLGVIALLQTLVSKLGRAPAQSRSAARGDGLGWSVAVIGIGFALLLRWVLTTPTIGLDAWWLLVALAAAGIAFAVQHGWAPTLGALLASGAAGAVAALVWRFVSVFNEDIAFLVALLLGASGAAVTTLWLRPKRDVPSSCRRRHHRHGRQIIC